MIEFPIIKANLRSVAFRKPLMGVGINDADYMVRVNLDGKVYTCPFYTKWTSMISRCYSISKQLIRPDYIGCSVSSEWLIFSKFKKWMERQNWDGMELDKDIKIKGNKIYSAKSCLFIPSQLNSLLSNHASARGAHPQGVCFHKSTGKFMARINIEGKNKHLGVFTTSEDASEAYKEARKLKIINIINDNTYPMATKYLEQHI